MQYAIPEFESIKPFLERLHKKPIVMIKVKNQFLGHTVVYYALEENDKESK
jgi:hypothetical protein